jgi:hypothetical protein
MPDLGVNALVISGEAVLKRYELTSRFFVCW